MENSSLCLVMVASPFQLLCAMEYLIEHNDLLTTHVMYQAPENSNSEQQILEVLSKFDLSHHTRIPIVNTGTLKHRIGSYADIIKSFTSYPVKTILIGDVRHQWMQDTLCSIEAQNYIMVDDGAAVLSIYQHILSKQNCMLPVDLFPEGSLIRQSEAVKIKADYGLNITLRQLGIFSLFNIPSPHYFKQHSFSNVAKTLRGESSLETLNEVHFVGTHFVELKLLSEQEYLYYLEYTKSQFPADTLIVYFPHRGENIEYKRNILVRLGFEIREISYPYEMFLMQENKLPSDLVGFYTTCLFNVKAIFADKITICYIKLKTSELARFKGMDWMHQRFSLYDQIMSIYQQLDEEDFKKLF